MVVTKYLIILAVLFSDGFAVKPIVHHCKQFVQQFNLLQDLVPLQVEVELDNTGYMSGPFTFRLLSELSINSSHPCNSQSTSTGNLVSINLDAPKSLIITPTRALTLSGNKFELTFQVSLSKTGKIKEVTLGGFSYDADTIYEDGSVVEHNMAVHIQNGLNNDFRRHLKDILHGEFSTSKRVTIDSLQVYKLMLEAYHSVAQDF